MAALPCSPALRRLLFYVAAPAVLLSISSPTALAQTVGIVCFGVGGQSYVNNTRCPGSNACCGHKATCLSNRLCHNPGDPIELWVRGPCAVSPFDATCGQICLYNETEADGGRLPRVTECEDGSLCCNNDPQCCQNKSGVFLDENGNKVSTRGTQATTSYPPTGTGTDRFTQTPLVSTSPTSTLASTGGTAASQTGGGPSNSGTPSPGAGAGASEGDKESTLGLKVGLGLGIPLAVLLSAGLVYFLLRRRNKRAQDSGFSEGPPPSVYASEQGTYALTPPLKVETAYYSGHPVPQKPAELGSPGVAELPAQSTSQRRYEMD